MESCAPFDSVMPIVTQPKKQTVIETEKPISTPMWNS
jgi:hypothetical protein